MLDRYDSTEFENIEYLATSGGLGTADGDARMAYYGNHGLPHLLFNGGNLLVGAGTDVVDGRVYDPIVQSMLDDATLLKMSIPQFSFDALGPFVTVDLALEGDLADVSHTRLRVAIVEDGLSYGGTNYDNVLRDMLPDQAVTISQAGQSQQLTINFTVEAGWNTGNLRLVAFVQDDNSKEVLQSANTRPLPDYSSRYYVLGERTLIGSGAVSFGQTGLFNSGALADTYEISLDTSGLPAGWSAGFDHEGGNYSDLTLALDPDGRALLQVTVTTAGTGSGQVTLVIHSTSGQSTDRRIDFKVITPDVQILLVDDDGGENYEALYFQPALATTGNTFATWDRSSAALSPALLQNFEMVVWECGWAFPTVDETDRAALSAYLDGGGNLFITGQDIGWDLDDQGGSAIAWYHDYLRANYVSDDTNLLSLQGVSGDPITDGLTLSISGGDGANNQDYPSDIDPRDATASVILTYDANRNGGIKADTGNFKVVYLSFGYEAINNAQDRAALMQGIVGWLISGASPAGDTVPQFTGLRGNVPNPFNPMTEIRYRVAREMPVNLGVFDVKGRLVREIQVGMVPAGEHSLIWDGTDDRGRALPSGTYFARLLDNLSSPAMKMMLVR